MFSFIMFIIHYYYLKIFSTFHYTVVFSTDTNHDFPSSAILFNCVSLPTILMIYAVSLSSTETFLITFAILFTLLLAVYNKFHSITEICSCSSLSLVLSFLFLQYIIFLPFFPRCHLLHNFPGSLEHMSKILFYPTKISFFLVLITILLNTKIPSKDLCLSIYLYSVNSSLNKRISLWL